MPCRADVDRVFAFPRVTAEEAGQHAVAMLGQDLVTKQTGVSGRTVKRLYVEQGCDIKRELYLSLLVDRAIGRIAVVASTALSVAQQPRREPDPPRAGNSGNSASVGSPLPASLRLR